MAYNKAREERKWLQRKEAEEMKLRQFGVSEDVIKKLRDSDWEDFKAVRIVAIKRIPPLLFHKNCLLEPLTAPLPGRSIPRRKALS